MNRRVKHKSAAEQITEGMRDLEEVMRTGKPLHELFIVHTVEVPDPAEYDAKAVCRTRKRLGVGQELFALLVGESAQVVERWEKGESVPPTMARRLLDEINRDPEDFLKRHVKREAVNGAVAKRSNRRRKATAAGGKVRR